VHRILVETSGSAFPAPLAWEVRRLAEAGAPLKLDAILCVIDCVNFAGYADKTRTARLQAEYTDLLLLNKADLASEAQMDRVLDELGELSPDTPRVRVGPMGAVDAELLIGYDTHLFEHDKMNDAALSAAHPHSHADRAHHASDVRVLNVSWPVRADAATLPTQAQLEAALAAVDKDLVFRVKGVVALRHEHGDGVEREGKNELGVAWALVNWAFGRLEVVLLTRFQGHTHSRLTLMGRWNRTAQVFPGALVPALAPLDVVTVAPSN
jgi:G3E family GTPase